MVDSGFGEAEADVDLLGLVFVGKESSALGESTIFCGNWPSFSISTSSDGSRDGRTSSVVATGGTCILTRSKSTFTLDGDLVGWSSKVIEDVEARGEGQSSSTLRAIARNLDMTRKVPLSQTKQKQGFGCTLTTQARVD